LREATKEMLPEATRMRIKKSGWNAPTHIWFNGINFSNLIDLINSRSFLERGIYNRKFLSELLDQKKQVSNLNAAYDGKVMFLWQLVNLELWHRSLSVSDEHTN